jgi:DNA ligase-4
MFLTAYDRKEQQPILAEFYRAMNPKELKWLVRIILRRIWHRS